MCGNLIMHANRLTLMMMAAAFVRAPLQCSKVRKVRKRVAGPKPSPCTVW